jgi:transposase-like protein
MAEFLRAAPGERSEARVRCRAGYYCRGLITRIGKIELRVPRDRSGEFSTGAARALPEEREGLGLGVGGERTGRVDAQDEGGHRSAVRHSFSASVISEINKGLDETLTKFARRRLTED